MERTGRQALRADVPAAAATLAAAFERDPWFAWLFDGTTQTSSSAADWFTLVLERAFGHGHVHVAPDAAAVWVPPDVSFPEAAAVQDAATFLTTCIGERAGAALSLIGAAGRAFGSRPPRWHCVYVGVVPWAQGQGRGPALLRLVLDRADQEGLPASLTSTNDANLPLYRRLGFVEVDATPVPGTNVVLRPMWREPRR